MAETRVAQQEVGKYTKALQPFRSGLHKLVRELACQTTNPLDRRRYFQKGIIHPDSCVKKALEFTCDDNWQPKKIEQIPQLEGFIDSNTVWNPFLLTLIMQLHEVGGILEVYLGGNGGHELIGQYHSSLTALAAEKLINNQIEELLTLKKDFSQTCEHSVDSASMLNNLKEHDLNLNDITEPLRDHGIISYKRNNPYTYATRDIDKIDTVQRVFTSQTALEKQMRLIDRLSPGGASNDVIDQFLTKGKVQNGSVQTIEDWILKTIAWRFDANFTFFKEKWDSTILPRQLFLLKYYLHNSPLVELVEDKLRLEGIEAATE